MKRFTFQQARELVIEAHLEFVEEMLRDSGEVGEQEIQEELVELRKYFEQAKNLDELQLAIANSHGMDHQTAAEGILAALADFE